MIQTKVLSYPSLNDELSKLASQSVIDIKPINNEKNQFLLIYNTEKTRFTTTQKDSKRVIKILAHKADKAWDKIEYITQNKTLEETIKLLCETTLATEFNDKDLEFKKSVTLYAPSSTDVIKKSITKLVKQADAFKLYELNIDLTKTESTKYGYVVIYYYKNDPHYKAPTTHIQFTDLNQNVTNIDFALDANLIEQWRLI